VDGLFAKIVPLMNTKTFTLWVQAIVLGGPGCSKESLCLIFVLFSGAQAFAWTDGELLIWITSNRPFHALSDLGKAFEKEVGAAVKVETYDQIIDRFQSAAQSGQGPDIFFWANDRIGEWADSGLLKPLDIKKEFKALARNLRPNIITQSSSCGTTRRPTSAGRLASAGGYPFKKTAEGYDVNDIGVANAGALQGLKAIVELINTGILPKGSTQNLMGEKMASGQLALMVSGPWDWANLRKAGVDFDLAPIPGVGGNPGKNMPSLRTV
jgi:maltose/maltodextrin transport system substrate-binding protein